MWKREEIQFNSSFIVAIQSACHKIDCVNFYIRIAKEMRIRIELVSFVLVWSLSNTRKNMSQVWTFVLSISEREGVCSFLLHTHFLSCGVAILWHFIPYAGCYFIFSVSLVSMRKNEQFNPSFRIKCDWDFSAHTHSPYVPPSNERQRDKEK